MPPPASRLFLTRPSLAFRNAYRLLRDHDDIRLIIPQSVLLPSSRTLRYIFPSARTDGPCLANCPRFFLSHLSFHGSYGEVVRVKPYFTYHSAGTQPLLDQQQSSGSSRTSVGPGRAHQCLKQVQSTECQISWQAESDTFTDCTYLRSTPCKDTA